MITTNFAEDTCCDDGEDTPIEEDLTADGESEDE